jgi:hypothetical protein
VEGQAGDCYLNRDIERFRTEIGRVFGGHVKQGFSEILFEVGFRLGLNAGRNASALGKIDSLLTEIGVLFAPIARQVRLEIVKQN